MASRFPDQADLFADAPEPEAAPSGLRGHLYSIAPHAPFLATLADRIVDGTLLGDWPRTGPFWLSDVTIILPTRRARLALADTFRARGHGLLPDIRTFGGEAADEEPFLPPHDLPELPRAVPAMERRLVLGSMIEAWAKTVRGAEILATPPNAAEILSLADSLGELIDDLAIEGIDYAELRALPPENLDVSWQEILEFLNLALLHWPALLGPDRLDAAELRNMRLRRQAAAAPLIFGDRPVIAAGSTGSIRATAELMKAIAQLPRGRLVLPGLDTSLSTEQHAALLRDDAAPHGHPQYGLAKLLRRLNAGPGEVIELAAAPAPRTSVVRRALALAEDTAQWAAARAESLAELPVAAEGLSIIAARTADEEARAVALCARDALSRSETVGIVSPDQNLSRRIAAELGRFGIEVDDPAGTPLFQSPAGRVVRIALALHANDYAPVELIALLRNKAVTLGLERAEVARLASRIELCLLRGRRLRPGVAGLREVLAANGMEGVRGPRLTPEDKVAIAAIFDRLEAALRPLTAAQQKSAAFAQTILETFAALSASGEPVPGAEELARWSADLAAHPGYGPTLPPGGALDSVLFSLMRGYTVRPLERRRDDIFIWGLLEARLQSPDLTILAGLNEDIWPQVADSGPWLSRRMRLELGLEPPERRQGQAAHDFEMAIGNGRAVLAYAERMGTSPALPSRLLQRVQAFFGDDITRDLEARGDIWIAAAQAVDVAPELVRATRPVPRPPAEKRPKQLSVTEIETLIRSPYDLYAKHTLGLRKLAPLGEAPDARDRGTIVHDIFARFVTDHDVMAPNALQQLQDIAVEAFAGLDSIAERRDIWFHRFTVAARQFLAFERARQGRIARRHAEIDGTWVFPTGFTLRGRADRVDILDDGTAEIIDFKTGGIPDNAEMTGFLAPQLPLEAAMLRAGVLEGIAPAEASALTYIKIGLGPEAFNLFPFRIGDGQDITSSVDEMERRLQVQVDALLLRDSLPMMSRVFPRQDNIRVRFVGDYDHLARVDEWKINEGDDSE